MQRILGHDRVIDILQGALQAGRLHHAWIFHGPAGIGARTTAEALAAILLDPHAAPNLTGTIEADPHGQTARLIAAGTHPDLHLISRRLASYVTDARTRRSKQTNIPADVVREFIVEPATRSGHRSGSRANKVFIVDEAELLQPIAQNILLKTLEEPPPGTVLILVTANEDELLPTIRSRCQRVAFAPLDDEAMGGWIKAAGFDMDAAQRRWLLRFAQGSPGLASQAVEHGLYDWYVALEPMIRVIESCGYPAEMGATMASLIDAYAAGCVKANPSASKESANRDGADFLFILLCREVHTGMMRAIETGAPVERRLAILEVMLEAERQLDSHLNLGQVLENIVTQWASLFDPAAA